MNLAGPGFKMLMAVPEKPQTRRIFLRSSCRPQTMLAAYLKAMRGSGMLTRNTPLALRATPPTPRDHPAQPGRVVGLVEKTYDGSQTPLNVSLQDIVFRHRRV